MYWSSITWTSCRLIESLTDKVVLAAHENMEKNPKTDECARHYHELAHKVIYLGSCHFKIIEALHEQYPDITFPVAARTFYTLLPECIRKDQQLLDKVKFDDSFYGLEPIDESVLTDLFDFDIKRYRDIFEYFYSMSLLYVDK